MFPRGYEHMYVRCYLNLIYVYNIHSKLTCPFSEANTGYIRSITYVCIQMPNLKLDYGMHSML